ncbi:MAG TPA: hypothetical protein VGL53_08365 [Bryobacteraceae bacterium]|jgi:hypothetical protein
MHESRLGDEIDDFCIKCKRLTNHAIVSLLNGAAAKVRCRTCYHDHDFRNGEPMPSKKDLKKQQLFDQVLAGAGAPVAAGVEPAAPPMPPPAPPPDVIAEPPEPVAEEPAPPVAKPEKAKPAAAKKAARKIAKSSN